MLYVLMIFFYNLDGHLRTIAKCIKRDDSDNSLSFIDVSSDCTKLTVTSKSGGK